MGSNMSPTVNVCLSLYYINNVNVILELIKGRNRLFSKPTTRRICEYECAVNVRFELGLLVQDLYNGN